MANSVRKEQKRVTKATAIALVLLYLFAVALMFAVNMWAKTYLGLEVDWRNEIDRSAYGTAIMIASSFLFVAACDRFGRAITRGA